jgi:hypothetical protein
MRKIVAVIALFMLAACAPATPEDNTGSWNLSDAFGGAQAISVSGSAPIGTAQEAPKLYMYCKDGAFSISVDAQTPILYDDVTNSVRITVLFEGADTTAEVDIIDDEIMNFRSQAASATGLPKEAKENGKLSFQVNTQQAGAALIEFDTTGITAALESLNCSPQ